LKKKKYPLTILSNPQGSGLTGITDYCHSVAGTPDLTSIFNTLINTYYSLLYYYMIVGVLGSAVVSALRLSPGGQEFET
jgi:DMSO reductase anchor subunit